MVTISIKSNLGDIKRDLNRLQNDIRDKVLVYSINEAADRAKTEMRRAITDEFNVKASTVTPRLKIKRARRGRGFDIFAELFPVGKRSANVIRFLETFVSFAEARRRTKASNLQELRFKFKKSGGARIIRGAFIANRGRTAFQRIPGTTMSSRSKYRSNKHSEALEALSVIDVPAFFNTRRVNGRVVNRIEQLLPEIVGRKVNQFLARGAGL